MNELAALRLQIYRSLESGFSSSPIRLMSRTQAEMANQGHADLATAIGDLDWRTVPTAWALDRELRGNWGGLINTAVEEFPAWMRQLERRPLGYNLEGNGSRLLTRAWSSMWQEHQGIEFINRTGESPQVSVFHGGNQSIHVCLQAVAERRRRRGLDGPPTILVPLPTFPCPLDQMALLGYRVRYLAPADPGLDIAASDIEDLPADLEVDGIYLMPINNPTGRSLDPEAYEATLVAFHERWPEAVSILDSVYVRPHPRHREMTAWYGRHPELEEHILIVDSLSKSHGVTGLRSGVILTRSASLGATVGRYCQNVQAGPSAAMQAMALALLSPFVTGHEARITEALGLIRRIGVHLSQRRKMILEEVWPGLEALLDKSQPILPDAKGFDWEGSMYAVLRLASSVDSRAAELDVPPAVAFYVDTGICGVPLNGFCGSPNLAEHGLVVDADDPGLADLRSRARHCVRLSFGMTPPPATIDAPRRSSPLGHNQQE